MLCASNLKFVVSHLSAPRSFIILRKKRPRARVRSRCGDDVKYEKLWMPKVIHFRYNMRKLCARGQQKRKIFPKTGEWLIFHPRRQKAFRTSGERSGGNNWIITKYRSELLSRVRRRKSRESSPRQKIVQKPLERAIWALRGEDLTIIKRLAVLLSPPPAPLSGKESIKQINARASDSPRFFSAWYAPDNHVEQRLCSCCSFFGTYLRPLARCARSAVKFLAEAFSLIDFGFDWKSSINRGKSERTEYEIIFGSPTDGWWFLLHLRFCVRLFASTTKR